jgi:hypothetical protein
MPDNPISEQPSWLYSRDNQFRSVYANNTTFASTAFDFSMTFAEIMEVDAEKTQIKAEQRVKVVMSPLHFKIFAATCMQNVENYEKAFGVIQLQDGRTGAVAIATPSLTEETRERA